eukprot:2902504-Pyramimonas_sp.AAC.2
MDAVQHTGSGHLLEALSSSPPSTCLSGGHGSRCVRNPPRYGVPSKIAAPYVPLRYCARVTGCGSLRRACKLLPLQNRAAVSCTAYRSSRWSCLDASEWLKVASPGSDKFESALMQ